MRIEEKQAHGHAVVVLESDVISMTLVPGKGADIVSLIHRPTNTEFLWKSPQGMELLKKPAAELRYIGGWFEVFPNAWGDCTHQGRNLRGYGDAWHNLWSYHIFRNDDVEIQVELTMESKEMPLLLTKLITLRAGDPTVHISETVMNLGDEPLDFTWGHHPNLGRPFINEDCVILLPYCEVYEGDIKLGVWPIIEGAAGPDNLSLIPKFGTTQENRQIYLRNMADSWAVVKNMKTGVYFKLAWDSDVFSEFLIWKGFHTDWTEVFGDNQILCLFPKRSFFNTTEAAQKGEAITLAAGEELSSWIKAELGCEQEARA